MSSAHNAYTESVNAGIPFENLLTSKFRSAPVILSEKYLGRIAVKVGYKILLVSLSDVMWIQSHGNRIWLNLRNVSYEHRATITATFSHLDPERFVRVHRNAIVNLDHVAEFDLPRRGNAYVHLRNGQALPISKAARHFLRRGLLSQSYTSAPIDLIS